MYVSVRDRPGGQAPPAAGSALRRVAPTVLLLGVVSLLTDVSSEMVTAILPIYLTAQVGLGILAYGFIDGIYQGVSALVRIAGGYAGDRSNRPKWIATAGYGISALSRIALLPAQGFLAITAVITADRLGKGLRTAPRDALIADASEPSMLGRAFGVHRALDTIGATIGPIVAFALLAAVPGGYSPIFVVSFAFAIVGVAVIVLFVPNRRTGGVPSTLRLAGLFRAISAKKLRGPLLASALLGVLTIGDGFLYLSLQQRDNLAASFFPLLFVGTNVAYLALAVPLGRLSDRVGRAKVLVGGHLALLAVYLTAGGPLGGTIPTVVTLLLLGTFYAATDGVLPALVTRLVPEEARGSGIAAAQTVVALSRFGASVGFGALWASVGRSQALLTVACLLVVALPAAAWLLRSRESE
ncbi:MFS transporter [Rhizocola hellebori]|uniref:MFS transporter n=1 Tax=Rhizocola hellebori TaxID=1392758 RepID=A0A8J3VLT1_9ACTN|nr:MFS transporter [Rhizocola hellebori]GIH11007.1 MFS transporter [Rhizocola hellebori]